MKQLLSILILISYFGYSQQPGILLKPSAINGYTTNGKVLITATDGNGITGVPTWTNTIPFSIITGTTGLLPTTTSLTINGVTRTFTSTPTYTVGDLFSTSSYTNPSWLASLTWSKITSTPTTISGYGITDPLINGTLTANYIPKAVSSTSLTNSLISENSSTISIAGNLSNTSPNALGELYNNDSGVQLTFDNAGLTATSGTTTLYHGSLNSLDAPNNNFPQETASSLTYFDASKNLKPVVLSGLSLSGNTLTATGSGSTTILTASTNITISGSAPNYTISTPTQTTGLAPIASPTLTGVPLSTTPSIGDNSTKIATTAFVNNHGESIISTLTKTGLYRPAKLANSVTAVTTGYSSGLYICQKLDPSVSFTVTSLSVVCTTSIASSGCRMGLYSDNNGIPGTLLSGTDTGSLSTSTTGLKEGTITATPINAGTVYWVVFQNTTNTVAYAYNTGIAHDIYNPADFKMYSLIHATGTFGSLPTNIPGTLNYLGGTGNSNMIIYLKVQ